MRACSRCAAGCISSARRFGHRQRDLAVVRRAGAARPAAMAERPAQRRACRLPMSVADDAIASLYQSHCINRSVRSARAPSPR